MKKSRSTKKPGCGALQLAGLFIAPCFTRQICNSPHFLAPAESEKKGIETHLEYLTGLAATQTIPEDLLELAS